MRYLRKNMVDRYEQVRLYSENEYKRRAQCLIDQMNQKNVQTLFFCECCEEAYDEWLVGERFLDCMIVRADGTVIGVRHADMLDGLCGQTEDAEILTTCPGREGVSILYHISNDKIANLLSVGSPERIGMVLPDKLNAELYDSLTKKLPKAELVDMSIPVAQCRAVKSGEELFVIQQACNVQTAVFDALPQMIRPGRRVDEIGDEIYYLLTCLGASGVVHGTLICNGPQDQTVPAFFGLPPEHLVEDGDRFFLLLEANGPGHHHVAFGRHLLLGEPQPTWEKAVNDAAAVHDYAVSLMRPGNTLAQIAVKTRKFANNLGYKLREEVGWNWIHSMGGYYYEQYSLEDYSEELPLLPNMLLHCHPLIYRPTPDHSTEELFILNTYMTTGEHAEDLFHVPKGLIVLGGR